MHCSTGTFGGCAFFRFHCVQYLQSTGDISVAVVFADELSLLLPAALLAMLLETLLPSRRHSLLYLFVS